MSAAALLFALSVLTGGVAARQGAEPLPTALSQMVETERAFAARALEVGWKAAFLEYFADDAIGFAEGAAGYAREQIGKNPEPPEGLQLLWEPRFGDIAASGDLGYLTGPVRNILPSRNKGQPRHSVYASVWKRQRNGTFKVVMDVGVDTPSAAPFAAGFTRAPAASRFTGDYDDNTPPLGAADGVLNSALRGDVVRAYRGRVAPGARIHRPNALPVVGEANILRWAASQPALAASDTRFAESSRAGDLGYSWGTYQVRRRGAAAQEGFYVRVWVRERSGQWKIAMDITQPQ